MPHHTLAITAPAKINLFLKILGRRPDGYHELYSLVQAINLCDKLTLTEIGRGTELIGNSGDVPLDATNIIWKAVELLRRETGFTAGIRVHLDKQIPIGAGLGGGARMQLQL